MSRLEEHFKPSNAVSGWICQQLWCDVMGLVVSHVICRFLLSEKHKGTSSRRQQRWLTYSVVKVYRPCADALCCETRSHGDQKRHSVGLHHSRHTKIQHSSLLIGNNPKNMSQGIVIQNCQKIFNKTVKKQMGGISLLNTERQNNQFNWKEYIG